MITPRLYKNDKYGKQILTTEHYQFTLHTIFRFNKDKCTTILLLVGNPDTPALSITMPFFENRKAIDPKEYSTANIAHIKKFRDAINIPVSDEVWETFSFSVEMTLKVLEFIRIHFPYIKQLTLTDDSQIPCSSNPLDKLDLLYYHLALHKETWYENKFGAYFVPKNEYIKFKCNVEKYANPTTKKETDWDLLYSFIHSRGSNFIYNKVSNDYEMYKEMYENATTLPDFFKTFANSIPYESKCFTFKSWIEPFLESFIGPIPRNWVIDLYPYQKGGKKNTRKHKYLQNKTKKCRL